MAVADDRKTISDDDIREVVAAVRDGRAPVPVTHCLRSNQQTLPVY